MSISSTSGSGRWLHALVHLDQRVLAALGVVPGFERWRGGAEDDWRLRELGAHHGDVARVVARILFLLVGRVVLFVDDDEAEVGDGREDGRARADDDARFAAADAMPLLGALVRRERGVEQRDLVAEGGVELRGHGGRQADLRHQQNGGAIRDRARAASRRGRRRSCRSR